MLLEFRSVTTVTKLINDLTNKLFIAVVRGLEVGQVNGGNSWCQVKPGCKLFPAAKHHAAAVLHGGTVCDAEKVGGCIYTEKEWK